MGWSRWEDRWSTHQVDHVDERGVSGNEHQKGDLDHIEFVEMSVVELLRFDSCISSDRIEQSWDCDLPARRRVC